jgi:Flp pilus assembly pilin Flp
VARTDNKHPTHERNIDMKFTTRRGLRTVRGLIRDDRGAATAEYAIATMAAVGLAGVLVGILKGNVVQQLLTNLITGALTLGG